MEEKKKSKEVSEEKKLSYEELNNTAMQLFQQNQELVRRLKQADMTNMFKRLDYLFMVLKYQNSFDSDFVVSCVEEIRGAMTVPEEPVVEEDK